MKKIIAMSENWARSIIRVNDDTCDIYKQRNKNMGESFQDFS